jgi:hypothetical protein
VDKSNAYRISVGKPDGKGLGIGYMGDNIEMEFEEKGCGLD